MSREQKIILLASISNLGKKYDIKTISSGFFRHLWQEKKILPYNNTNCRLVEKLKSKEQLIKKEQEAKAQNLYQQINNLHLSFNLKKDKSDKVFGSISNKDIVEQMKKLGFLVEKSQLLDFLPLNKLGENLVKVKLSENLVAQIKINIIGTE